jgi:hypothetical protein
LPFGRIAGLGATPDFHHRLAGLKLESTREPVDFLVIDHIEPRRQTDRHLEKGLSARICPNVNT